MPTAVRDADCSHVVGQPVLSLYRAVILGCISWQLESFWKLLCPDAVAETCWTSRSFLFLLCILLQKLNTMPCIIQPDLPRTQPIADRRSCHRLNWSVIPPTVNSWLFCSSIHHGERCPIAFDPALMPRLGWLSVLARCIRSLARDRNRHYSRS